MDHRLLPYPEIYKSIFKEIVENPDGTLNLDKVMRELADYAILLENASRVYCAVTNYRISMPSTASEAVIAEYEDCLTEMIDEEIAAVKRLNTNA